MVRNDNVPTGSITEPATDPISYSTSITYVTGTTEPYITTVTPTGGGKPFIMRAYHVNAQTTYLAKTHVLPHSTSKEYGTGFTSLLIDPTTTELLIGIPSFSPTSYPSIGVHSNQFTYTSDGIIYEYPDGPPASVAEMLGQTTATSELPMYPTTSYTPINTFASPPSTPTTMATRTGSPPSPPASSPSSSNIVDPVSPQPWNNCGDRNTMSSTFLLRSHVVYGGPEFEGLYIQRTSPSKPHPLPPIIRPRFNTNSKTQNTTAP